MSDVEVNRSTIAKHALKKWEEFESAHEAIRRFVTSGNAGGVVACVSFMGVMIAKGQGSYPWPALLALSFFLLGASAAFWQLVAMAMHLLAELRLLHIDLDLVTEATAKKGENDEQRKTGLSHDRERSQKQQLAAAIISFICMFFGVTTSIIILVSYAK